MIIKRIYFDMDGVLADFDRGVSELCGLKPREQGKERSEEEDTLMWEKIREVGHFYDKLEPVPGALEMFEKVYGMFGEDCQILTGIPKPKRGIESAGEDKTNWAHRLLSDKLKVNIVYREEKKRYCFGKEHILIDDLKENIESWEKYGGTGILFRNAEETMKILEELMEQDWRIKLQMDFPFMKQNQVEGEKNLYRRYGFECAGGWYPLLRECCEEITKRYAKEGIKPEDIDFEPAQIKEKFGTLRFYYGYQDAPCGIAAIDMIGGSSIRFDAGNEDDDEQTKIFRQDIARIVHGAEEKSAHTCEHCGAEGTLRKEGGFTWILTLCDACQEKRMQGRGSKRKELEALISRMNDKE